MPDPLPLPEHVPHLHLPFPSQSFRDSGKYTYQLPAQRQQTGPLKERKREMSIRVCGITVRKIFARICRPVRDEVLAKGR